MKILLSLIAPFIILTGLQSPQTFPFQELTISEFVKFEKSLGSTIKNTSGGGVISMGPSKDLYPYVDKHNLAQPYRGERSLDADSMVASISAYFEQDSKNVKFVSYTFTPKAKSPEEIAEELRAEGYSSDNVGEEFAKRLNNQQNDPGYQQKLVDKYEKLVERFSEKGKIIEKNDSTGDDIFKESIFKIKEAHVEVYIAHWDDIHKNTTVNIYWK